MLTRLAFVILVPLFIFSLVICLNKNIRTQVLSYLKHDKRTLLSTVTGDLMNNGTAVKVLKLKTSSGIFLEFLGSMDSGSRPLLEQISLGDPFDAYFDLAGEATRLAIVDLNGDGKYELIAPTFDENMTARLNAYRFNESNNSFEPIK